ncbi:MAG TPA: hypothetical protein VFF73_28870 [Planctomycetota bacterium]|nr:hypothetical protein [Planctomycetota bacterium]
MSTFEFPGEITGSGTRVHILGPRIAATEHEGRVHRPTHGDVSIARDASAETGDLKFARVAITSREWNNRDKQDSAWPEATLTYERPSGGASVAVLAVKMKRMLVTHWSLSWSASKPTVFTESLAVTAYHIKRQSLLGKPDEVSVHFDSSKVNL